MLHGTQQGLRHTRPVAITSSRTTLPVGMMVQKIKPGMTMLGLTLHHPVIVEGKLSGVSGKTLTDAASTIAPPQG